MKAYTNVHFVPINLEICCSPAAVQPAAGCLRYTQLYDGVSLLATTPALIYRAPPEGQPVD